MRTIVPTFARLLMTTLIPLATLTTNGAAQVAYKTPPAAIVKALEALPLPGVSIDPTRTHMLLMERISLPPVADLARPMLRLAGGRYDPDTNGPHGPRRIIGYTLKSIADGVERKIELPADSDLSAPAWSPDGTMFAFTRTTANTIELWLTDVKNGKARSVASGVNAASGGAVDWMPDGKRLLVGFVPTKRLARPKESAVPIGPVIQETSGAKAQVPTFQDLLQNPQDERTFDWLMQTQLAYIDTATGSRTDIGPAAIYSGSDASPDGRFLLISRIVRPYSYLVTAGRFPEVIEVWDAATGKVFKHLADAPLREEIPIQGVEKGPRSHQWRDTAAATLIWAEALDGGDPKAKVPHRDRVMVLDAPFAAEPREWLKTEHRFMGLSWLEAAPGASENAFVSEYDRDRRWSRTWLYWAGANSGANEPRLVFDRSTQDQYNNPGSPVRTRLPNGRSVIRVDGPGSAGHAAIYLAGQGASADGDRPFLDMMSLADFKTERLWRNDGDCYEAVIDLLQGGRALTSYETPTQPANYYIRDIRAGTRSAVTSFTDPVPELRRVKKELVKYKRADGVDLSSTLYLPADYQEGTRLPLLVWAYPLEFNDASTAGQVLGSSRRFTSIAGLSHLFLLTQGYAVMDAATMPVIGDPETVNDTFVDQITQAAAAAINFADSRGVADPKRVAVGGHSYGAFMTANLLAHTDLFKAGIARSGAYNRTLTPFGFQGERRTYWEAVDTYTKMSPFTFAQRIKAPLLMTHGQMDSNPGTFPVQSERLYAAIKGNGGTARLVLLPFEDHGYSAKESVMHVQAEMVEWLDKYVKNAKDETNVKEGEKAASAATPKE